MSVAPGGPLQQSFAPVVRPGINPVSFGAVIFSTEEVPELFPIGAVEQMISTHDLPGGGRVVNAYGNKPRDVSWTGRFWGPNIKPRVTQLREYLVNASEQFFSYTYENYFGIITSFDPGYRGGYNEYQITIEITHDANGAFAIASQTSIDQQVATLQNQMTVLNADILSVDQAGASAFQSSLQQVNAALASAAPLSINLHASSQNIITLLGTAQTQVLAYQATTDQSSANFVNTVQLGSTLAAIQSLIVGGEAPATQAIQGGSLFALAAARYGDPSQAFALAQANGLRVPFVTGQTATVVTLPNLTGD